MLRKTLLSLSVVACLAVPTVAGALRVRDARRADSALAQGAAMLDRSIGDRAELASLPTREARTQFQIALAGLDEDAARRARSLTFVCDAIDALARGEYAAAGQAADAALRLRPDEPIALLVSAQAAAGRGDRGSAERSIERMQRGTLATQSLRARGRLLRAGWLLDAGRAHEALDVLEALDRDAPRVGAVLNLLGLARSAVGDRLGATRAFEQAIDSHPHREVALLNLARSQREQGQLDEAKSTLERALGVAPDYADGWVAYGVVLADLRASNARHVLVRAAQLAPTDATPLAAQGALDLADQQFERAAESFRQALQRDPEHAIARTNLGIALARLGRSDLALRAFEEVTQRAPHVGEAWNGLGALRLQSGQFEPAVAALRQAVTLLPDDPNPSINLGRALEGLQQWDAAARSYREALRRHPQHAAAAERLLALTPPEARERLRVRLGFAPEPSSAASRSVRAPRASRTLASRR
ncbi:MAG: tetratricopeptide repeat protein [Myxococcales bacterium]|nr:tetratricopeptide repeat protein [Myxococcales bacterium]